MYPGPDSTHAVYTTSQHQQKKGVSENNLWKIQTVDTLVGVIGDDNSKGGKLAKIWGMSSYLYNKNSPFFT